MKFATTILEVPEESIEALNNAFYTNAHESVARVFDEYGLRNKDTVFLSGDVYAVLAGILTGAAALADAGRLSDDMVYTLIDYLVPNVYSLGIITMLLLKYDHEEASSSDYSGLSRKLKAAPFIEKAPRDCILDGLSESEFLDYCCYIHERSFNEESREVYDPFGVLLIRYIYFHKMISTSALLCFLQIYMDEPITDSEIRLINALYGDTAD